MKTLLVTLCLFLSSIAQSANIDGDIPSSYFKNNPDAVKAFIKQIDEDHQLSSDEKIAYKALVSPKGGFVGDSVLDMIDPKVVQWFYGIDPEDAEIASVKDNNGLLHNASKQYRNGKPIPPDEFACFMKPLCVHVSLGQQRMFAYYYGKPIKGIHNTKISSGRNNNTPTGTFTIDELANEDRVVRRAKWNGAALYWAMQLDGHIFIHSTSPENYKYLGTKASGGCIRTTKEIAGKLNNLMRQIGGRKNGVLHDKSQVMAIVTHY